MEQTESQQSSTRASDNAQLFINALHALEQATGDAGGEINALVALYAPNARLTNAALKLVNEEKTGTKAIRTFWADYKKTLGQAYSEFHHVAASDNTAGLFWVTKGTAPSGEGDAIHYDGATLLEFDQSGKITFFQGYYDTAQLNRQMGLEKG